MSSLLSTTPFPVNFDFEIWSGATFRQQIILTTVSGVAINIGGFTGVMAIRQAPHIDPPFWELTTANGGISLDSPENGIFSLIIPAAITRTFTWKAGIYDLLLNDNSGVISKSGDTISFLKGKCTVKGYSP